MGERAEDPVAVLNAELRPAGRGGSPLARGVPTDPARRCTASTQGGRRCRNRPLVGARDCRAHGGAAELVRAARARFGDADLDLLHEGWVRPSAVANELPVKVGGRLMTRREARARGLLGG